MEVRSVEAIVGGWNAVGVRYMIAGGLAVVAHGYMRFTADVDAILEFEEGNLSRALQVLESLGYTPRVPVSLLDLADDEKRRVLRDERNMLVLSFSSFGSAHRMTEVDVFVDQPLDFEDAYARAEKLPLPSGTLAVCVSLRDLLDLKRQAGRPQDLADIDQLTQIHPQESRS
jgi:hypothetical protein